MATALVVAAGMAEVVEAAAMKSLPEMSEQVWVEHQQSDCSRHTCPDKPARVSDHPCREIS